MATAISAIQATTPLSQFRSVVDDVMNFEIDPVVERYAQEHDASLEVAREHERELKRFLVLASLHPERSYGMCGPVDDLWHTFILHTQDYVQFCDRFLRRYLHHIPGQTDESNVGYLQLLSDYSDVFGEEPPIHIWPRPTRDGRLVSDCRGPSGCKCE